jgi:hypothetical protein
MMNGVPNRSGHRFEPDAAHGKDGLGGLVGAGPSKVGIDGAMRARDVARPSAEDLAEAQRELVLRHAAPRGESRPLPHGIEPAPLPAGRGGGSGRRGASGGSGRRPMPRPPQRKDQDQPPGGSGGSVPEPS